MTQERPYTLVAVGLGKTIMREFGMNSISGRYDKQYGRAQSHASAEAVGHLERTALEPDQIRWCLIEMHETRTSMSLRTCIRDVGPHHAERQLSGPISLCRTEIQQGESDRHRGPGLLSLLAAPFVTLSGQGWIKVEVEIAPPAG